MRQISKRRSKQGSYFVEAALTLPVLVLCVVALALLIEIVATCEQVSLSTAHTMREIDMLAYKKMDSASLCKLKIGNRVRGDCEKLTDFRVKQVKYLYRDPHIHIDDLIGVKTVSRFSVENLIGISGRIVFEEKLVTRGFTGALQDGQPLKAAAFTEDVQAVQVVVFPRYGMRYHRPNCRYVQQHDTPEETAYMLKMDRAEAERKGYTPCMVCKGG